MFSRKFASVWCGVTEDEARYAIKKLCSDEYQCIQKVGTKQVGPHIANLFLPYSVTQRREDDMMIDDGVTLATGVRG